MLVGEQQKFINEYVNSGGDFYGAMDELGIEYSHIISWRSSNPDFESAYQQAKTDVMNFIKEQNYTIALQKLNHILRNGVIQHEVTRSQVLLGDGSIEATDTRTKTKHLGVPAWAIKQALNDDNITSAVQCLVNEGVLPSSVGKRIYIKVSELQKEISSCFDISNDNDMLSEKKAVSLIKQAILGVKDNF